MSVSPSTVNLPGTNSTTITQTVEDNGQSRFLHHKQFSTYTESSPLSNIRVLDLTRIIAGPYCTQILSDLGADVIKVEKPVTGDESRRWGPPFLQNSTDSVYFLACNRNKRSVCIDLKSGLDVVYDLAKTCDVLIENYVPGKLDKLGLGYNDLKKIAPSLIYCSITGFGSQGPYKNRAGYDVIAASMGGLLHITGEKKAPSKVGVAMTDIATGLYAHGAILAALLQRQKSGQGQKIDVDLLSTQISCLINVGVNYLNANEEASRWGTEHVSIVPYAAFKTKDGFFTIGAGSDDQFKELCRILDVSKLSENPKFVNNQQRVKHREELKTILSEIFERETNEYWNSKFEKVAFPYGPINNMQQVFNDRHVKEIGLVKTLKHSIAGDVKVVGSPVVYSDISTEPRSAPPSLGQHTDEVLKNSPPTLRLRLHKPKAEKKVQWTETTVDNEGLNKKKSKCCCIYVKPKEFGESSSESEDDCENCYGHVEMKKHSHEPTDPPTNDPNDSEKAESPT
ncbi:CLUMA_CG007505, isoform A [Clunio marinus]|uniref:CLUMA_CG007505, isoform A n=1 Tax=Clunio marinus TaxID=568069 RepID=A0A1J1I199_9DIPT|nr:CLUMA_CG007505, isoform A [Clunio marinus]